MTRPREPTLYRPLLPIAIAFAGGLVLADVTALSTVGRFGAIPPVVWFSSFVVGTLVSFAIGRRVPWLRVVWCVPWICLGIERGWRAFAVDAPADVGRHATESGRLLALRGTIVRAPVAGGEGPYELACDAAGEPWRRATGRVGLAVRTSRPTLLSVGDRVSMIGYLRTAPPIRNPGARDVSRAWRRRGLRGWLSVRSTASVTVTARAPPTDWRAAVERFRRAIDRHAAEHLRPATHGLFRALLLGERDRLDPALARDFRRGGVLHFLAISGLHVVIVGHGLFRLLRRCGVGRGLAATAAVFVLLGYAGVAGFRTPVVRAAVLAGGSLIAPALLRGADPWNLMGGAALVTLCIRPGDLFSAGFALSYGAVAGILLHAGRFDIAARRWPDPRGWERLRNGFVSGVTVSFAATTGSAPFLWAMFGAVYPWAPFVSPLVLPVFVATLVIALGFALTLPVTMISLEGAPFVADAAAVVVAVFARLFEWSATALSAIGAFASNLPGAQLIAPDPGAFGLVGAVGLVVASARFPAVLLAVVPWLLVAALLRPAPPVAVTVIDVGQGMAGVIVPAAGPPWLIDAGSTDIPDVGTRVVAPFLRATGIGPAEAVVVSHRDHDHMSGVRALVEDRYAGREIADRATLRRARPPWLTTLHPPPALVGALGSNDRSLAVGVTVGGLRVLFPGDVEAAGIACLLRRCAGPVDVLVMPHHGSDAWNLPRLLARLRPRVAVISARRGFASPRTHARLRARGIAVYETWRHGAIRLRANGDAILVETHRTKRRDRIPRVMEGIDRRGSP